LIDEGQIARKRNDWTSQRGDELLENNEQRTTDWALYIGAETVDAPSARSRQNGDDEDDEGRQERQF